MRRTWLAWGLAVTLGPGVGVALGLFLRQVQFSLEWGFVRDLAAPWAVAPFIVGCAIGAPAASAVAGWLCVSAAVVTFYGLLSEPVSQWMGGNPWIPALLVAATIVGPAMAVLGAGWRRQAAWGWVAAGFAGGVLAGEGAALAYSPPTLAIPAVRFLVEAVAGLTLAAGLTWSHRRAAHAVVGAAVVAALIVFMEVLTGLVTTLYTR